ncbi:MAG: AAA family ATPase [Muribaculaceae bacterium]|nr:AAA family ATPase [Muribaculaceae bacterium]
MDAKEFAANVLLALPYTPNDQQVAVIAALARFCSPAPTSADRVFVVNGYAGTGKTSLTGALVKTLATVGVQSVLLAPTGRAAKVFGAYAGHQAYTIHRKIYRHQFGADYNAGAAPVQENDSRNTVFIVDEASMIGAGDERGGNLLEDLIHYVYSGENCKLILLGDTAQLPPVGSTESPAMNADALRKLGLKVSRATLTATARQQKGSGILYNATWLRRAMASPELPQLKLTINGFDDVAIVAPEDLPEQIETAYGRDGVEETLLITRSNRSATEYNRAIRARVLYIEEELQRGELLIVAKNNYYWTRKLKGVDFIANGDVVKVTRVKSTERRYGLRFADVELSMPDRGDTTVEAKLMIETLNTDSAGMTQDDYNRLYYGLIDDPEMFPMDMPYELRVAKLRDNPYWNALQVKYAYAATCHKAQGGQWSNVFVDVSYVPPEAMGVDFYRWLYTAVTRARKKLFFIMQNS